MSTVNKKFNYPTIIKEQLLDTFGHVNNSAYLVLFEEARWEFITQNGFGLKKIQETQIGPTIVQMEILFKKELKLRDEIVIESQMLTYDKKLGQLLQIIKRNGEVCCEAKMLLGLFDLRQRKLISPTPEWQSAIGIATN